MENGYTQPTRNENLNDACRRVNNEGWIVKQIIVIPLSRQGGNTYGLLLERPDRIVVGA